MMTKNIGNSQMCFLCTAIHNYVAAVALWVLVCGVLG